MPNPFFHFKKFSVYTHSNGLKVTTDACLLGALAETKFPPVRILDIGTGSGVIAMMLAQRFENSRVVGIELLENVYQQAADNFKKSPFSNRIQCIHGDFLKQPFDTQFELIVCNPPYFSHLKQDALRSLKSQEKSVAMHNQSLNLNDLCSKVKETLTADGLFWAIMPPTEMEELIEAALSSGLYVTQIIHLYNRGQRLHRQVIAFSHKQTKTTHNDIVIQDDKGYTDEFRRLMHDFYLENTENYKH